MPSKKVVSATKAAKKSNVRLATLTRPGLPWGWLAAGITLAYALVAFWSIGSTNIPQTFYTPSQLGESFTIDLGGTHTPDRLYLFTGSGEGLYQVDISADGQNWQPLTEAKRQGPFIWSWSVIKIKPPAGGWLSGRYLRWKVLVPGEMIFEIAVTDPIPADQDQARRVPVGPDGKPWPGLPIGGLKLVVPDPGDPLLANPERAKLLDEPETFMYYPDPQHDMVFDEVYHSRTAWEFLNHVEPYEWTHPPLGKLIIAASVAVLGMDPLGWRVPGVIFGIAMLPLVFLFARRLFGDPVWALVAELLLALDFMHFTQSRLGTVDVFLVFFIIAMLFAFWRWYTAMREEGVSLCVADHGWLALSGLFFGLAAATKWNGLYPAAALAILFFVALVSRVRRQGGGAWVILTLATALIGFVVVPAVIYCLSYFPFFLVPGHQGGLAEVLAWQPKMYAYHADLNVPHDFATPWWQWPLMIKPMWYYTARDTMPQGLTATVVAFGNPAIWWLSVPALAAAVWRAWRRKDVVLVFLVAIFLSMYLPWIVAPRKVTFIYHYFPMVPVVILMIVRLMQGFREDSQGNALELRSLNRIYAVYLGLALLLFLLFYPVLSGVTVPVWYVNLLHWLPTLFF
jgi:predicted membrane-bound dolichyl-phosphate-mannose-protein mannosyltransferase